MRTGTDFTEIAATPQSTSTLKTNAHCVVAAWEGYLGMHGATTELTAADVDFSMLGLASLADEPAPLTVLIRLYQDPARDSRDGRVGQLGVDRLSP